MSMANPAPIVGPQYCAPSPADLAVVKKVSSMTNGDFVVADVNDSIMFKVKEKYWSLHDKKLILDAAGNPILTLRQKAWSAHSRWRVFRGDSSEPQDLIFTARTSSVFYRKTKLNVYLASNPSEEVCDFKVEGSWSDRSCVVYQGESSNIVAQMHERIPVQSSLSGKEKLMVTVYPNIDYAFVVALIVILDAIHTQNNTPAVASSSVVVITC